MTYKNFVFASKASIDASFVFLGTSPLSFEEHDGNDDDANEKQCSQHSTDYCSNLTPAAICPRQLFKLITALHISTTYKSNTRNEKHEKRISV